jgi:hypothetical protein
MKAPLVALAATAAGFAAASAYLYGELGVERVLTQAEVAARSKHESRIKQIQTSGVDAQASVLPFSQMQASSFVESQPAPPRLSMEGPSHPPPSAGPTPATADTESKPPPLDPNRPSEALLTSERIAPDGQGVTVSAVFTAEDRDTAPRIARRLMRERESNSR